MVLGLLSRGPVPPPSGSADRAHSSQLWDRPHWLGAAAPGPGLVSFEGRWWPHAGLGSARPWGLCASTPQELGRESGWWGAERTEWGLCQAVPGPWWPSCCSSSSCAHVEHHTQPGAVGCAAPAAALGGEGVGTTGRQRHRTAGAGGRRGPGEVGCPQRRTGRPEDRGPRAGNERALGSWAPEGVAGGWGRPALWGFPEDTCRGPRRLGLREGCVPHTP